MTGEALSASSSEQQQARVVSLQESSGLGLECEDMGSVLVET